MNGFAPNFTGYDLDQRGINWYDMYHNVTADVSLEYVRTAYIHTYIKSIYIAHIILTVRVSMHCGR